MINSYNVTFVFDNATVTTTVLAVDGNWAHDAAFDALSGLVTPEQLKRAQEIVIEVLEENI
jgi:hypothetical protein